MRCIDDHEARRRRKKVSGVMHVGCWCLIALAAPHLSGSQSLLFSFRSSATTTILQQFQELQVGNWSLLLEASRNDFYRILDTTWQHHLVVSTLKSRLSSPPTFPLAVQLAWRFLTFTFFSTQATPRRSSIAVAIIYRTFCHWLSLSIILLHSNLWSVADEPITWASREIQSPNLIDISKSAKSM